MGRSKYEKGKRIESMSEFVNSKAKCFYWNRWAKNRAFIENWQYAFIKEQINRGVLFEAKERKDDDKKITNDI